MFYILGYKSYVYWNVIRRVYNMKGRGQWDVEGQCCVEGCDGNMQRNTRRAAAFAATGADALLYTQYSPSNARIAY